jgi:hypothetical protein
MQELDCLLDRPYSAKEPTLFPGRSVTVKDAGGVAAGVPAPKDVA